MQGEFSRAIGELNEELTNLRMLVDYGTVYARKEGGGIVGQMEPSSTLEYTKDTLQELSDEMSTLQTLVNRACDDASAASSDLSNQLEALKNNVTSSRNAIENLLEASRKRRVHPVPRPSRPT